GLLIPIFGIGFWTALTALIVYALLPIVRNTYAGIAGVDPAVREAGRGMGMTDLELLRLVALPLAAGVILAAVRVASGVSVGVATWGGRSSVTRRSSPGRSPCTPSIRARPSPRS